MSAKPYDSTLKVLVETEPESWPALLGQLMGLTDQAAARTTRSETILSRTVP